jgi:hypothetical protein
MVTLTENQRDRASRTANGRVLGQNLARFSERLKFADVNY